MSTSKISKPWRLYNKSCFGLAQLEKDSIDALLTDPPYGIAFQNHYWDKALPNPEIWTDCLNVLKPGSFGVVFSSIKLMHRLMVDLEDGGFLIKDVLFWAYLNGMPKSRDVGLDIDKTLGVPSRNIGTYRYAQGYRKGGAASYTHDGLKLRQEPASELGKKYKGAGLGVKPAYEPMILIQKPTQEGLTVAENVHKYGTGSLNLEETRIPYEEGETHVGHNPHPKGRVPANIVRTETFNDGYDKFFTIPKVRQHKDDFNFHPTIKPVELMIHLVHLTTFAGQVVLDPFAGSGSTGVACLQRDRRFIGYELDPHYFEIADRRLLNAPAVTDRVIIPMLRKTPPVQPDLFQMNQ
jgi:site-specific DNA-methyltransferase (adenine-specific)